MTPLTRKLLFIVCFSVLCLLSFGECSYEVFISDNGPIVQGGRITFQADLYYSDGSRPKGQYRYYWEDNSLDKHQWMDESGTPTSTWNVTYPSKYYPGPYEVEVKVDRFEVFLWIHVCSRRQIFNITALLNGKMDLVQGSALDSNFVSNETQVVHEIALSKADLAFVKNATQVLTYWFIDCNFYGESDDFTFNYTYGAVGADHTVEALVVVSFEPIITTTTPAPTTTTVATTTSSTPPPVTSTANSSLSSTTAAPPKISLSAQNSSTIQRGPTPTDISHIKVPYVCLNTSIIPPDPKKTYGYFQRKISVRSPVNNITIKGTNWLQQFEQLNLQVMCRGSSNFTACDTMKPENYNVTGEETCDPSRLTVSSICQFNVTQFYSPDNYTVLFIVSNDVNKVVYPIKVILYKVQKNAQLSVIVVPVVCSLVAVILVVFGVAYYVQRRKRFTVEVADFDFGHDVGDMEYKTFRERLREAFLHSVNRDFGVDGEGNVWSPSRKYGSMH